MNLLDDIIMDKFDKVIKIAVFVVSLVLVFIYCGGEVKKSVPKMQNIVRTYEDSKELLEELSVKEEQFNSSDVVYGYILYLYGINNNSEMVTTERIKAICSDEENESLLEIVDNFSFEMYTTAEELEKMKDKSYALQRFGIDNYTTIYNIVESHKDDF